MMKKKNFLARFVFVLTLVFFVSQFVFPTQGQSSEDRILAKLNLKEGMTVADVGAGNGQFSVKMARLVIWSEYDRVRV
jgi:tRNA A58 N-methylase Trm61